MEILYYCDPMLNKACDKTMCFMHDGPCVSTRSLLYAKQPVTTVQFVVDRADFADTKGGDIDE